MKETEIVQTYEDLKKNADKALGDVAERNRRIDLIEEIVGFVFTVLLAFIVMMLALLLVSFVGLAYVRITLVQMIIWSAVFAFFIGVLEAYGLIRKHKLGGKNGG